MPDELPFVQSESTDKSLLRGRGSSRGRLPRSWSRPLPLVAMEMVNREGKERDERARFRRILQLVDGAIPLFFFPPLTAKSDRNRDGRALSQHLGTNPCRVTRTNCKSVPESLEIPSKMKRNEAHRTRRYGYVVWADGERDSWVHEYT